MPPKKGGALTARSPVAARPLPHCPIFRSVIGEFSECLSLILIFRSATGESHSGFPSSVSKAAAMREQLPPRSEDMREKGSIRVKPRGITRRNLMFSQSPREVFHDPIAILCPVGASQFILYDVGPDHPVAQGQTRVHHPVDQRRAVVMNLPDGVHQGGEVQCGFFSFRFGGLTRHLMFAVS